MLENKLLAHTAVTRLGLPAVPVLYLPISPYISLYLLISPHICPHLPTSAHICPHLPTSPLYLPQVPILYGAFAFASLGAWPKC